MEKEKNSQQDLGARSHGEAVSRNESVEKLNEIPGRQIMQEPDPLVEIRSAVHSNYAGMIAMLGADNRVYLGREEHYSYQDGQPGQYDNRDGSLLFVSDQPDIYYFLYGEGWAHTQEEMLERGLTLRQYQEFARLREGVLSQLAVTREILFGGQPFQEPENYLKNAELYEEGQTGNYNMLNGTIDNEPPVRPDLTDGQTHEEIRELAPQTLPGEKPSLMERLKADRPEHEARQMVPPGLERGIRTVKSRRTFAPKQAPKVGLLVDIEAAVHAGKGPGYERWARVFNIKQLSQAVIYLKEHGDMSYADLQEKASAATARFNELSDQIKNLESQMNANGELQKQIVNYAKTRAVYVDYRKAGYSKKFRAEHEADILIHQAAKKHFDRQGITKLPSVKALREEYAGLLEQKRKAYAAYKQVRSDMRELQNVKANVDYLLDIPAGRETQPDIQKSR